MGHFLGKLLTLTVLVEEVDLVGLVVEVGETFTNQVHQYSLDNQQSTQQQGNQTTVPSGPSTTGRLVWPRRQSL